MRNRAIPFLVIATILPATFAHADEYRQRLGLAYTRLQQAGADLSAAMSALNDAAARQVYYDAGLTAAILRAQASRQAMSDAQREIDFAQPELQRLAGVVDQKRAAFEVAKANADAATGDVEKYRQAAVAQFESSPAFQQRTAELMAAQRTLEGSRLMFEQWLRTTGEYAELYNELEETEEVVRALRRVEPQDREALAMASYDWLEALNAFEKFRAEAHATDSTAKLAAKQVDEMTRLRETLINQFNHDLAADPAYKQLVDAAGVAQSIASSAANDVNAAEAQRVALVGDIDNLRALMGAEDARLAQAAQEAAAYQAALASVGFEVQQYEADYVQLCSVVYVARSDCDNQVRRCRESIDHARGQRGRRDWENGNGHGTRGGGGGESFENEQRQAQLIQQNRGERSRIAAEAEARRQQEQRQRHLSDEQVARERAQAAEETDRREKEKQRSQEKRDREAHQRDPVQGARVVADQQPKQREPESKPNDRRADAQRQVEARERAEREQQQQQQSRASQERRESESRKESQAQAPAKADEQRRTDDKRGARESRRSEESRKSDEGRKADELRRADESRRADDNRKVEESRRADDSRRAAESRRADDSRRNEESRKRDDDSSSRRQSEQRDRDRDNNFRKR